MYYCKVVYLEAEIVDEVKMMVVVAVVMHVDQMEDDSFVMVE